MAHQPTPKFPTPRRTGAGSGRRRRLSSSGRPWRVWPRSWAWPIEQEVDQFAVLLKLFIGQAGQVRRRAGLKLDRPAGLASVFHLVSPWRVEGVEAAQVGQQIADMAG